MNTAGTLRWLLTLLFICSGGLAARAQFSIGGLTTTADIVNTFVNTFSGTGVTISNVSAVGASAAFGTYGNFTGGTSTPNGFIISSGNVLSASSLTGGSCGLGDQSDCFNTVGEANLTGLAGTTTFDAAFIEFDFTPTTNQVSFRYSFGSDEYLEYVNAGFNDVFGFFVNGPNPGGGNYTNFNIARLPNNAPVSIDNVNNVSNPGLYINNPNCGAIAGYTADGSTTTLETVLLAVVPCQTYRMRIAIADAGDCVYNSYVLLQAGSFGGQPVTPAVNVGVLSGGTTYEFCPNDLKFNFNRPGGGPAVNIPYTLSGTATNGSDYTLSAGTINFANGQTNTFIDVIPILDGITPEPDETVILTFTSPGSCVPQSVTAIIRDGQAGPAFGNFPTTFCPTDPPVTIPFFPPDIGLLTGAVAPGNQFNPAIGNGTYTITLTNIAAAAACPISVQRVITVSSPTVSASASPNPICGGGGTTLSASGANSYVWNPGNLPGASVGVTPASTTTYTVVGTTGGCTSSATVTVTVSTSFTVSASASASPICIGSSTNLSANAAGAVSYVWQPGNLNGANQTVSPAVSTIYTVTATDGTGCTATNTVTVDVQNPVVNVSATPATICAGQSTNLSADGGGTHVWQPGNLNGPNQTVSPATTTTYTVTRTNLLGCVVTNTITVTVNSAPAISAPNAQACWNTTTTLSASSATGVSYVWSPNTFLNNPNLQNPTFGIAPPGTYVYAVTVTDGAGCTASTNMQVSVPVVPNITPNPTSPICAVQTANFGVSGASSYVWSPATNLSNPNIPNPVFGPAAAGTYTYTITGTDGFGCTNTATLTQVVNANLTVTAPNASVCANGTVGLSASGATSYVWSPATNLSNANIANPTFGPAAAGTYTYTVTGTGASGCTGSAVVTVTVNALPNVTATGGTVCTGGTLNLSAGGATSYVWSPATNLSNANIANPVFGPAPNGTYTYTVTGTDGNGCTVTAVATVTVSTALTVNIASVSPICSIETTTLSASGAVSYVWSPATNLSNANIANPVFGPAAAGTYTYTVTGSDAGGCTDTEVVSVTVNTNPTVSASGGGTICQNATLNLSASGATSYVWNPATNLSNANIANPVLTGITAGTITYTVTGTAANGCTGTATVTAVVNALPVVTAIGGSVCAGGTLNLSAGGAVSYSWSPAANLSASNIANPVFGPAPNGTYTYTVTGTDANGCTATVTASITVATALTVSIAPVSPICSIETTTLNASGAVSYVWSPATNLSNANIANPVFGPAAAGTYTYTVTGSDAGGCTDTEVVSVTVNANPTVSASGGGTICQNATLSLSASGAVSYSWSPGTNLSVTNVANPTITGTSVGTVTYTVTGTAANGCTGTATVTAVVNPLPNVTATGGTVCSGGTLNLSANGAASYLWSPTTNLSNPNIPNPVFGPAPNGTYTYTVTGTDANGCTDQEVVTVTVSTALNVSVAAPAAICSVESTVLTASGAVSYSWTPASNLSATNIANPTFGPAPAGNYSYTVTGTDAGGCTDTEVVTITVNPTPNVTATGGNTICEGNTLNFSAAGASTYSWSPATNLSNPSIANPVFNGITPGTFTYTVTGTSASGCTATATVTAVVNALPTVTASGGSVCSGSALNLSASGAVSYSWSPAANLSATNIANPVFGPAPNGTYTYTVTGTDANGCTDQEVVTVTVSTALNVNVAPVGPICSIQSVTLNATGATSYVWSPAANLSDPNIANPTFGPAPAGSYTYTVTGTDASGCTASTVTTIVVNAQPNVTATGGNTICEGNTLNFSAAGALTYSWSPATNLSNPTIANPVFNGITPGTFTYTVTGTDANGCTATATVTAVVNDLPVVVAAGGSICTNGTLNLSASGASTYVWSPAANLNNANIANPVFGPAANGSYTYTVTGTDANGCTDTEVVTVTVSSALNVSVVAPASICSIESPPLTASGGVSYAWSPAANLSAPNVANPVFGPAPAGVYTYTVTGTDAGGCTDTEVVSITVNPNPTVTASGGSTICLNNTLNFSAAGASSYVWSPVTNLSNPTIANPVFNGITPGTFTYTVTGTDANGCTATATVTAVVNDLPAVVAAGGSICTNGTLNLSASGASTYVWSPAANLSATNIANPVFGPAANGTYTYTVTGTDANGCTDTEVVTVTVSSALNVSVVAPASICSIDSPTLTASGGVSYVWSPAANLSAANVANPVFGPAPAGVYTYTVTGTDAGGCTDTEVVSITVNPNPTVTASGGSTICLNNTLNFSAAGASSYAWSPVTNLSNPTIANPVFNGITPGTFTYTVTGTDANGCTSTATVTAVVNDLPVVVAAGGSICTNGTLNLSASGTSTYVWSPSANLNNPNIANPVFGPAANGTYTYTVTGTDANGCTDTEVVTVTVSSTLNVNAAPVAPICSIATATFSATGANTYVWNPAANLSDPAIANPVFGPAAPGSYTYTVTGTDASGCTATATTTVVVNAQPTIVLAGGGAVCQGGTLNLSASGATSYVWSPITNLSDPNSANPVLTATTTGSVTYTVTGTDANGCTSTSTLTVTVNALPPVAIAGASALCSGQSTVLTASGAVNYSWAPAAFLSNAFAAAPTFGPAPDGTYTYTVTGTDANGCANSATFTVSVAANLTPTISGPTAYCAGGSITLSASGSFATYTWNGPITGNGTTLVVNQPGSYTVTVTDAAGCVGTSSAFVVTQNPLPVASISGTPSFCQNGNTVITASGAGVGGSYLWAPGGATTAAITVSSANTYTVTVTDNNGCTDTESIVITQFPTPAPTIAGPAEFCTGTTATLTATPGFATYAWSGGLGSGQTATVSAGGSYTVTVTDANGCVGTSPAFVINELALPVPVINGPNNICSGTTITLNAPAGFAAYSWSNGLGNGQTATVSGPGSYTVTVTDAAGCVGTSAPFTVVLNNNPVPVVTGPSIICTTGGTATLVATPGFNSYSWVETGSGQNVGNTPTITVSAAGTYVVTVTDGQGQSGCTGSSVPFSVAFVPNPVPTITGNLTFCANETTTLSAGQAFASYSWTGGSVAQTATFSAAGLVTLTVTDGNGCTGSVTVNLTTNPIPNISLAVPPVSGVCQGTNAVIVVQNSELGVNYVVTNAAGVPQGPVAAGTGADLNVTISAANLNVGNNTFIVNATIAATGCTKDLTAQAQVNVTQAPAPPLTATAAPTCIGQDGIIVVQNSQNGLFYQVRDSVNAIVTPNTPGTGGNLNLVVPAAAVLNGNNSLVIYTFDNATGCLSVAFTTVVLPVSPGPNVTLGVTAQSPVCQDLPAGITVVGAAAGVTYQVVDAAGTLVAGPVTGAGANLVLTVPGSTLTAGVNTLTVQAQDGVNGCVANLLQQAVVDVLPLPDTTLAIAGSTVCQNSNGTVTIANSQVGVSYVAQVGAQTFVVVQGTGAPITLVVPAANLNLGANPVAVVATNTATGCDVTFAELANITVTPEPVITNVQLPLPTEACAGADAVVTVFVSTQVPQLGYSIQTPTGVVVAPEQLGTGGNLALTIPAANLTIGANSFVLVVRDVNGGCTNEEPITVTVNPNPATTLTLLPGTPVCFGQPHQVTVVNAAVGTSYQAFSGNQPVGQPVVGQTGGNITLVIPASALVTGANVFTVQATSASNCVSNNNAPVTLQVLPVPTATLNIVATAASFCEGTTATVTIQNSQNFPFPVKYVVVNANGVALSDSVAGTGGDITLEIPASATVPGVNSFTVIAVNGSNGCVFPMANQAVVNIIDAPSAADFEARPINPVCFPNAGIIEVITTVPIGFSYQVFTLGGVPVGIPVPTSLTTNGKIDLPVPASFLPVGNHTFIVRLINNTTTCASPDADTVTLNVNPKPADWLKIFADTDQDTLTVADTICLGSKALIRVVNAAVDVTYQAFNATGNVGLPVHGIPDGQPNAGDDIFLEIPASALIPGINVFQVRATSDSGCVVVMLNAAFVMVNVLPSEVLPVNATICANETKAVIQLGPFTETTVEYTLQTPGGVAILPAKLGTGSFISFEVPIESLSVGLNTFRVRARSIATLCEKIMDAAVEIVVNPQPVLVGAFIPDTTICGFTDVTYTIRLTENTIYSYQITTLDGEPVSSSVVGTGGDITLTIPFTYLQGFTTHRFVVVITDVQSGCKSVFTDTLNVRTVPAPAPTLQTEAGPAVCQGQPTFVKVLNPSGNPATTYQVFNGTTAVSDPVTVSTAQTEVVLPINGNALPVGDNQLTVVATINGACATALVDRPVVTILPLPVANLPVFTTTICLNESAQITLANSSEGIRYQVLNAAGTVVVDDLQGNGGDLKFSIPGVSVPSDATGTFTFSVRAKNNTTGCEQLSDQAVVVVNVNRTPDVPQISGTNYICENGFTFIRIDDPANNRATTYTLARNADGTDVVATLNGSAAELGFSVGPFPTDSVLYVVGSNPACPPTVAVPFTVVISPLPIADFQAYVNGKELNIDELKMSIPRAFIEIRNTSQFEDSFKVSFGNPDSVFVGFYDDADTNALALTYRYEGAGQYAVTLIAKNDLGCTDTITKRFYLVGDLAVLDMPNTFSPNNDGLNDLFIYDLAGYDEHTIWIYDRWGRQVFTNGGDITRFWDGRNADGTMMPEGVFTYKLIAKRLRANEIREVSGTITVLR